MVPDRQMAHTGLIQVFFTPISMTDFLSFGSISFFCSFMAGEDMRGLGEVSSVVHRAVLPTATSVQLSPAQHPTGQDQGD